jgi:hypothetical protein
VKSSTVEATGLRHSLVAAVVVAVTAAAAVRREPADLFQASILSADSC